MGVGTFERDSDRPIRVNAKGQVVLSKEDIDRIAEAVFERVEALLAEERK